MNESKFFTKRNLIKLLIESGLIVFSVLFALFLNEYRNSIRENKLRHIALMNVKNELENNLETVRDWLPYHREVLNNFRSAIENDSINQSVKTNAGLDLRRLMPRGLVQSLIDDTSWETLRGSPVAATVNYDTLLKLSKIYKMQNKGVQQTLDFLLREFTSREMLRTERSDETLLLFRNGFSELVAQEITLISIYEKALETF